MRSTSKALYKVRSPLSWWVHGELASQLVVVKVPVAGLQHSTCELDPFHENVASGCGWLSEERPWYGLGWLGTKFWAYSIVALHVATLPAGYFPFWSSDLGADYVSYWIKGMRGKCWVEDSWWLLLLCWPMGRAWRLTEKTLILGAREWCFPHDLGQDAGSRVRLWFFTWASRLPNVKRRCLEQRGGRCVRNKCIIDNEDLTWGLQQTGNN